MKHLPEKYSRYKTGYHINHGIERFWITLGENLYLNCEIGRTIKGGCVALVCPGVGMDRLMEWIETPSCEEMESFIDRYLAS